MNNNDDNGPIRDVSQKRLNRRRDIEIRILFFRRNTYEN